VNLVVDASVASKWFVPEPSLAHEIDHPLYDCLYLAALAWARIAWVGDWAG